MILSLIAALTEQRVIGRDNQLPWHLPDDLQHFKQLTLGKSVLMGRKTFQSIGKPLPGRENIIITRDQYFHAAKCTIYHSLDEALTSLQYHSEICIVGGAEIFTQTIVQATYLHLTIIHADVDGDTFFPEWQPEEWQEIKKEYHAADDRHAYAFTFLSLARNKAGRICS